MKVPKRGRLMCTSRVPKMDMNGTTKEDESPYTTFRRSSHRKLGRL
jgi:hypothetical protein